MKRRTEVVIEIEREIIITQSFKTRSWCINCGKQVQMLTASEAAQMIERDESLIHRLAESGELHFAATIEGMLLICPESLAIFGRGGYAPSSQLLLISDGRI